MSLRRAQLENGGLVVLALVLLLVTVNTAQHPSTRERELRQDNLLPAFDATRLSSLSLLRTGTEPITLTRDTETGLAQSFSLSTPDGEQRAHADDAAVTQLLSTLEHAPLLRSLPADAQGDFGFNDPLLELRASVGQLSLRLLVGKLAPTPAGARYVQVSTTGQADAVGVISESVVDALSRDGRVFLGKLVFRYGMNQSAKLLIGTGEAQLKLVRDELGFRLGKDGPRADRDRVEGLFFQMARTSLAPFTPLPKPTTFQEVGRIEQVPKSGPPLVVRIADACPGHPELLWLHRTEPDPISGCAPRTLPFQGDREHFTSLSLAPVHQDEVDHVIITWQQRRLDLVRQGKGFLLQAPEQKDVSLEHGREFLTQLLALRGTRVDRPSGPPSARLQFSTLPPHSESAHLLAVSLFPTEAGELLAWREDDGVTLRLPESAQRLLNPALDWFTERQLLSFSESAVAGLSLDGKNFSREELRRTDAGFVFAEGRPADTSLVDELLHLLQELQPESTTPKASETLSSPTLSITLSLTDGSQQSLTIGQRVAHGFLSTSSESTSPFVLAPGIVRELHRSLHSRAPAQLASHQLERVELVAFGRSTTLERRGEELVAAEASAPELGEQLSHAIDGLDIVAAIPEPPPSREPGPAELTLTANLRGATPQHRVFSFGRVLTDDARVLQRLHVTGSPVDFYVDRASVLRLLDLL